MLDGEHFFCMIEEMRTAPSLSDLELFVLLAVARLGDDAYGVSIAREIESTGKRAISLGTVYAVLDRMEQRCMVTSTLADATPERGGRSKRYFQLTGEGLQKVRATRDGLSAMWQGVPDLQGGVG